jgi:N-acyl-D-aspartate/D-glutamate deacylase
VADLVAFDPEAIADRATFESPTLTAAGVRWTWVAGTAVWDGDTVTAARPGRALRPSR